jgi:poly(A) polymerase
VSTESPDTHGRPRIVPRSEHSVSRKDIDRDALTVLYRLHHAGYTAYLVGGGVRDLLLGRKPKDFDVGTNAHPQQVRKLFRNCFLIGRRFRLAHIKFGQKVIETCTFRRQPEGAAEPGEFQERDNTYGTPEEDARRRDFTINGIFYDIKTFSVIDHVGGLADLDAKVIRTIGDPNIRFREDPVRMVRAVRFASRLGFAIEPTTWAAIREHHGEIAKASSARMLEEIYRLFPFRSGEESFRLLYESGLMSVMFPEVYACIHRHEAARYVFWRLLAGLDRAQESPPPPARIFACLAWPLFDEQVRHAAHSQRRGDMVDVAEKIARPMALRYSMPKAVFFSVVNSLVLQLRLGDPPPHKDAHGEHLRHMDDLAEALAFRRLLLAARQESDEHLKAWQEFVGRHPLESRHHGERSADAGISSRDRRRRRPRRRYRGPREPSPSPAPERRDPLWKRVLRRFKR